MYLKDLIVKNETLGRMYFQIEAVWEAKFSEVYSGGIPESEMGRLNKEFLETINSGQKNLVGTNLSMLKLRAVMVGYQDNFK